MRQRKREVIFIRHGESVTNGTDLYQAGDQFEIDPLTETGVHQAEQLAEEFSRQGYTPEIIISSYYKRALQTAMHIRRATNVDIIVPVYDDAGHIVDMSADDVSSQDGKSLFRELDLPSDLEGLAYSDPIAKAVKEEVNAHQYDEGWHHLDEENLYDIWQRAGDALNYISAREEQRIVVVAHGGLIKACLARIMFDGQPGWSMRQKLEAYQAFTATCWVDNTGVVSLFQDVEDNSWQWLITYNSHLKSSFGFMNTAPKGEVDTSADELLADT